MDKGKVKIPDTLELNLSDFALFLAVVKNREAHECILGIILDELDLKLEEDYSTVAEICETAEKFAPDYDSDSVCEEYFNK